MLIHDRHRAVCYYLTTVFVDTYAFGNMTLTEVLVHGQLDASLIQAANILLGQQIKQAINTLASRSLIFA